MKLKDGLIISFTLGVASLATFVLCDAAQNAQIEEPNKYRTESSIQIVAPVKSDVKERVFVVTGYCSCEKCCGEWAKNRPLDKEGKPIVYGASGERLISGVSVAVDPSVIPYGTVIEINGRQYVAHDCGGAVKGYAIDIYCDSHEEAAAIGKNTCVGYIKEVADEVNNTNELLQLHS